MRDLKVIAELKRISLKNKGILKPETIVEEARARNSPLHDQFTWDNTVAAEKYRLWEARHLLNVCVELIGSEGEETEKRVFVSLRQDREEGGYRLLDRVVSSISMRESLLNDALEELNHFRSKYKDLQELIAVFEAIENLRK